MALTLCVCVCVFCLFEGGCCGRRAVWQSVVGSRSQATGCVAVGGGFQVASEGGRHLWVDDAPVGSGLLTAASCLSACAVVPYAVVKLLFVMAFVCGS